MAVDKSQNSVTLVRLGHADFNREQLKPKLSR